MECKVIQANRFRDKSVLIETLWNVKPVTGDEKTNAGCINRNIMECKEASASVISTVWWCINRNIMECKDTPSSVTVEGEKVLIETLWNVK